MLEAHALCVGEIAPRFVRKFTAIRSAVAEVIKK
jgi:hypothetical protein